MQLSALGYVAAANADNTPLAVYSAASKASSTAAKEACNANIKVNSLISKSCRAMRTYDKVMRRLIAVGMLDSGGSASRISLASRHRPRLPRP